MQNKALTNNPLCPIEQEIFKQIEQELIKGVGWYVGALWTCMSYKNYIPKKLMNKKCFFLFTKTSGDGKVIV